jgi:hypothetical protein
MMMTPKWQFALLVGAMVPGLVALWRPVQPGRDVRELQVEVARLESQLEGLRRAPRLDAIQLPAGTDPAVVASINAGLAQLAGRLTALEEAAAGRAQAAPSPAPPPADPDDVAVAEAVVADRDAPLAERVQALGTLRRANRRPPEVALAMMEVALAPGTDERMRADIVRNLGGLAYPELKAPLLSMLEGDMGPRTKQEVVETLEGFLDDPQVHAAVVKAREQDPSDRVRHEAGQRLSRWERRNQQHSNL